MNRQNILVLIKKAAEIAGTLGDKTAPVFDVVLRLIEGASPLVSVLFPQIAPFVPEISAALKIVREHGPEIADNIEHALLALEKFLEAIPGLTQPST